MSGLKFKEHVRQRATMQNGEVDRREQAARDIELIEVMRNPATEADKQRASTALFEQYRDNVLYWTRGYEMNWEEQDDVRGAIFLRAHEQIDRYDPYHPTQASFRTWLYRLAQNVLKNHARNTERRLPRWAGIVEFQEAEEGIPAPELADKNTPEDAYFYSEALDTIKSAFNVMPRGLRDAFLMEQDGKTHENIEQQLGLAEGQARLRCHRARQYIKAALELKAARDGD